MFSGACEWGAYNRLLNGNKTGCPQDRDFFQNWLPLYILLACCIKLDLPNSNSSSRFLYTRGPLPNQKRESRATGLDFCSWLYTIYRSISNGVAHFRFSSLAVVGRVYNSHDSNLIRSARSPSFSWCSLLAFQTQAVIFVLYVICLFLFNSSKSLPRLKWT